MKSDFSFTVLTDKTPHEVYLAVNNVRAWWTGFYSEHFEGNMEKLNDEFTFTAGGGAHVSKQKLVEVVPDKRLVWLIYDSEFTFIEKPDEWTGTKVIFDISKKGNKTQLVFTHEGLTPEIECYNECSTAWSLYLTEKLTPLINATKNVLAS